MSEAVILIQGGSMLALLKIAIDLGKILRTIEQHEKRLDVVERKVFS